MKTKTLFATLFFIVSAMQANAQETLIPSGELPKEALAFLNAHFKNEAIDHVIKDTDYLIDVDYKVSLANGTTIKFDKKGNWEEVDGKQQKLPESFIPKPVLNYVKTNFPNATIQEVEKSSREYEVKLSNGLELTFNAKGSFVKVND